MFAKSLTFNKSLIQPALVGNKLFQANFLHTVSPKVLAEAQSPKLPAYHPVPPREEYWNKGEAPITTQELEKIDVGIGVHRKPLTWTDTAAANVVKALRIPVDLFFKEKWLSRGIMLETVAAVPGLVAGSLRHLSSLRMMRRDGGWVHHLFAEAENERMHLLTWMEVTKPKNWERALVWGVQGVFWNVYFILYLFFPQVGHRVVGYLEEEAVISYTHMLKAIDEGKLENGPAPDIAKKYWNLAEDARIRDVVLAVRADEAQHRDVNHHLCDRLLLNQTDLRVPLEVPLTVEDSGKMADKEQTLPRIDLFPSHVTK